MARTGRKAVWTLEAILAEARKYTSRGSFAAGSPAAYQTARNRNWLDKTGLPEHKWTEEALRCEAKKYRGKGEFRDRSRSAYNLAYSRGIMDDLFPPSPSLKKQRKSRARKK